MKPLTLRWIDKYKEAKPKPTTPDVIHSEFVPRDEEDSEKSYAALMSGHQIFVSYVFLYQTPIFMFCATVANIALFGIHTFQYSFLEDPDNEKAVTTCIRIACYLVIGVEIMSSILHRTCKKIAQQRALAKRSWTLIIVDLAAIFVIMITGKLAKFSKKYLSFIELFRLIRVFIFYNMVSSSPGKHTASFSALKFAMVLGLVIHISTITIQIFCSEMQGWFEYNWHGLFVGIFKEPLTATVYLYMYELLISFSALANMGTVNASLRNTIEQIVITVLSLFGLIYSNGIFLGNYTSLRLTNYQIKTIYYNKLKLINKHLEIYKVPRKIRNKIKNYYLEFWNNEAAINKSVLVDELPMSLQYAIYLDKYWPNFENSNFLPDTHYGFKRFLSYVMETRVYSTGEVVYFPNSDKSTVFYIHRGNVQVLSAEDMESPLITFGVGTIIGETSLIVSSSSPLQIVASTYCVAYCISKDRFWKIIAQYRKLQQARIVHNKCREIFAYAREQQRIASKDLTGNESTLSLEGVLRKAIETRLDGPKITYVMSQVSRKRSRVDEIFINTTFPWVLNSSSKLILYWDLIIVVFTFIICIGLPYMLAFRMEETPFFHILEYYILTFNMLDVIVYMFVAIEDETGIRCTVLEILMKRLHSVWLLDIVAAIPYRQFLNVVDIDMDESEEWIVHLVPFIHIVKIHKIARFFSKIENSFKFNLATLRLLKYNLYLAMCAYIMTATFFILAMGRRGFRTDSWVHSWMERQPELNELDIFWNTFKSTFDVVLAGGVGILGVTRFVDVLFMLVSTVIGLVMFVYIAADYSATMTLSAYELGEYSKTMQTIQQLSLNPLFQTSESKRNMDRIYAYLSSQWYFNRGAKIKELLSDGPETLYDLQQIAKYEATLEKIAVFQNFGRSFCNFLATLCEEVQFSENTVFVNESQTCEAMYIIDRGYCELIDGSTRRIEKTLGPGSNICVLEAMLGISNLFFVRSITCIALVRISKPNLQAALRTLPYVDSECQAFRTEMQTTILYSHFMKSRIVRMLTEDTTQRTGSFFFFPNDKTDPLYQDFVFGWSKFSIFRYILLPVTIMPDGPFIIGWEIMHNILSFAVITVGLTYDYWASANITWSVSIRILEVYHIIAMYVRFHICYYDKKGILISHPRLTAYHYLCGAFMIDAIGVVPITAIARMVNQSRRGIYGIYNINKVLLLYRLPSAFYYFKQDVLKPTGIVLNICFFMPITIAYLLTCTCIVIALGANCETLEGRNNITPKEDSILWILTNLPEYIFKTTEPLSIFLIALYYTAANSMQLGAHSIIIRSEWEVFSVILICLSGYMIFTYILVIIANSQTIINSELTLYQNHMRHSVKFMKSERVPKHVQRNAVQYYEYSWQQMHGLNMDEVLAKCHTVLREDFLFDQYKNTFAKVGIFTNLDSTIYRELSGRLTRIYMLPNVEFIKMNDIVSRMYIIHSGRITVTGPGLKTATILENGAMFGCLDNISHIRSMVSFRSIGSVDLLEIEAKEFYSLMVRTIIYDLKAHLLTKNLSYVPARVIKAQDITNATRQDSREFIETKASLKSKILNGMPLEMTILIISFASVIYVTYMATFYPEGYEKYILLYIFDALHVIVLILKLITPFIDSKGQLITDNRMIRNRVVKLPVFYCNLLAIIPFDAIFLIEMGLPHQLFVYRALILTRLLRIYNIYFFFGKFNDILNSDTLIMKLLSIIVNTTLLLHFETCILYSVATKFEQFYAEDMWAYQPDEDHDNVQTLICGDGYVCSFFFATSLLTFSGYPIFPRTLWDLGLQLGMIIFSKFIQSVMIAMLSACIQNYGADLALFDTRFTEMKRYLRRSALSPYLIKRVTEYCEQLWICSKGVQSPYLLQIAPSYLKEEIKIAAFGGHIYNNILFANAHPDLLRHVISVIEIQIFFENDTICEQGDINETMYFVHSGNVDVWYYTDTEEIKVDEIQELDCFGVIQGLYERTPHTHTFRCTTVTTLCTLSLKDWNYILDFYPSSKWEIYDTLYNMPS